MSESEFHTAFATARRKSAMTDREIADVLCVSWPSVARWNKGVAAPHPLGREPIIRAMRSLPR